MNVSNKLDLIKRLIALGNNATAKLAASVDAAGNIVVKSEQQGGFGVKTAQMFVEDAMAAGRAEALAERQRDQKELAAKLAQVNQLLDNLKTAANSAIQPPTSMCYVVRSDDGKWIHAVYANKADAHTVCATINKRSGNVNPHHVSAFDVFATPKM